MVTPETQVWPVTWETVNHLGPLSFVRKSWVVERVFFSDHIALNRLNLTYACVENPFVSVLFIRLVRSDPSFSGVCLCLCVALEDGLFVSSSACIPAYQHFRSPCKWFDRVDSTSASRRWDHSWLSRFLVRCLASQVFLGRVVCAR